jgi:hypothetical protein
MRCCCSGCGGQATEPNLSISGSSSGSYDKSLEIIRAEPASSSRSRDWDIGGRQSPTKAEPLQCSKAAGTQRPMRADLQLIDMLPHPASLLISFLEHGDPTGTPQVRGLQVGPGPTVQMLVQYGAISGTLTASLEARPVDSYVRVVGTSGTLHLDLVRDALYRQIGSSTTGASPRPSPLAHSSISSILTSTWSASRSA